MAHNIDPVAPNRAPVAHNMQRHASAKFRDMQRHAETFQSVRSLSQIQARAKMVTGDSKIMKPWACGRCLDFTLGLRRKVMGTSADTVAAQGRE